MKIVRLSPGVFFDMDRVVTIASTDIMTQDSAGRAVPMTSILLDTQTKLVKVDTAITPDEVAGYITNEIVGLLSKENKQLKGDLRDANGRIQDLEYGS